MQIWVTFSSFLQASLIVITVSTVPVLSVSVNAQNLDTTKSHETAPITVEAERLERDVWHLDSTQGTYIYSGKKTEVIDLKHSNAALAEKIGRQIFAKVPGVFVYDMDGTGNQVNIATRGLDPHRGWEFNVRKDGIITNSDMYGYPASHYNIPMEAVDRIELVRGTGSLQYGAQFGGMLNYISKPPDTTRPFAFESINTVGSYGLVSTYNRASGTIGDVRYSAWVNKKYVSGYRDNGDAGFNAEAVSLFYNPSDDLRFKLEWTHSNYVTHLPGPLTDSMFTADPRQSTRARNFYNPDIHVPSITVDWQVTPATLLQLIASAVIGERNSVLFDKPATIADTIIPSTLQYNNRQVDIDNFKSYTTELRLLQSYPLLGQTSTLATGVQYMNNDLHRRQLGLGTTGSDFDLSLVAPVWGRDLHFKTTNIALFAENRWKLTERLSVNTGMRVELGNTRMTGTIGYYADSAVPNTIKHAFPLLGINAQYDFSPYMNVFAGWSQAYRPVIFKDIIPASVYEVSDKNLKDARGYNAEFGFRGSWKSLTWDVTGFVVQYDNRMGLIAQTDTSGNQIIFRTNIGNANTKGFELFLQNVFLLSEDISLSLFTSTSFMDARYQHATIRSGNTNVNIHGNQVESAPSWISRNGCTVQYASFKFSALYSYTSDSFADALNVVSPSPSGSTGLVPAYGLLDLSVIVTLSDYVVLQLNASNVSDRQYFTKRPQFYPGPGIWPSDGRTLSGTVSVTL